ncbi:MAG: nuclear transport factor 2 family protein [Flavobacteriales bacterium]|nr:nuclear transport factor 2 family protein [Flavobacteriales bacterium]
MKGTIRSLTIVVGCALAANPLNAQTDTNGHADVRAVVDRLFAAMEAHDSVAMAAILVPDGVFHVVELGPNARPLRSMTNTDFIRRIASAKERLVERYWSPTVVMDEGVAAVWCAYDFHVDGKLSHCGHDLFNLVKGPGGWRIASGAFTRQVENCPPSPLGPLR